MITKINAYKSSDGTAHSTLEEAQKHELSAMFSQADDGHDHGSWDVSEIVDFSMRNTDKIVDILTMKPNSLPKARKINGGRKPRKHIAEQATMFNAETPKPAA